MRAASATSPRPAPRSPAPCSPDLGSERGEGVHVVLVQPTNGFSTRLAKVAPSAKVTVATGWYTAAWPLWSRPTRCGRSSASTKSWPCSETPCRPLTHASAAFLNAGPVYSALGGEGQRPARANLRTSTAGSGRSTRRSRTRATCRRRRPGPDLRLRRQPADACDRRVRVQPQADRRSARSSTRTSRIRPAASRSRHRS